MKKRQEIRSFVIILTFLSLPVTQFYFSPYLIVWGASHGIITASFFTFAFLFFGSLLIGRAFCGWVMPCAGMQETFFQINDNNPHAGKLNYLKYVIWVPWIVSILVLVMLAGGYNRIDYFFIWSMEFPSAMCTCLFPITLSSCCFLECSRRRKRRPFLPE